MGARRQTAPSLTASGWRLPRHHPDLCPLAQHGTSWDGPLSLLLPEAHVLATRGLPGPHGETYSFVAEFDSSVQLLARGRLVTAVAVALDDAYAGQASPWSVSLREPWAMRWHRARGLTC